MAVAYCFGRYERSIVTNPNGLYWRRCRYFGVCYRNFESTVIFSNGLSLVNFFKLGNGSTMCFGISAIFNLGCLVLESDSVYHDSHGLVRFGTEPVCLGSVLDEFGSVGNSSHHRIASNEQIVTK